MLLIYWREKKMTRIKYFLIKIKEMRQIKNFKMQIQEKEDMI